MEIIEWKYKYYKFPLDNFHLQDLSTIIETSEIFTHNLYMAYTLYIYIYMNLWLELDNWPL
jgi:hypothetical protein